MKPLCLLLLLLVINEITSARIKTLEKRQICNGNQCGNACDGTSCNSCNQNTCCSSVNCNQCVNQCSNNCQTTSCKNNCVSGCNVSCQKSDCSNPVCSQCVNQCSQSCSSNQCVNNCAKSCTDKSKDSGEVVIVPEAAPIIINNTNIDNVNLTAVINIDNVIHNYHNISIPVYVNTTNINNINLSETREDIAYGSNGSSSVITIPVPVPQPYPQPIPQPIPFPYREPVQDNCCTVMHPKQCYTDDEGQGRCYIRRSRECSSACTSPVMSIEREESGSRGCQTVNSWPYAYCGNYVRRDCGDCYTCGGSYNPGQCSRMNDCSEGCRLGARTCGQRGGQCGFQQF